MKIKRRGFLAALAVIARPAFGGQETHSLFKSKQNRIQKFKSVFALDQYLLPKDLTKPFLSSFWSFEKIGYRFKSTDCLVNSGLIYAVCPVSLTVGNDIIAEDFLFFQKSDQWQYVGSYNKYELDLLLNLASQFEDDNSYKSKHLLPRLQKVARVSDLNSRNFSELNFEIKLKDHGIEGRLAFTQGSIKKEVFLENTLV